PQTAGVIRELEEAARARGVQLVVLKASTETAIDNAFASVAQSKAGALLVQSDPFLNTRRQQLVSLASGSAIPTMHEWRESVTIGGLISYAPSIAGMYHQLGIYAGKILNGAKPVDLPVQQPTKFELVINLKTAKALGGLSVPQALLVRADEVIE